MTNPHNDPDIQLSLFDLDTLEVKSAKPAADKRPLPLLIAKKWDFVLQHHEVNGVYWFSLNDWYAGVAQKSDVRSDVKRLLERNPELLKSFNSMEYRAVNNRRYQMAFGQDAAMYEVAQQMQSTTGVAKQVKQYLIDAGVVLDRARRDPAAAAALSDGLDALHNRVRSESKKGRNVLTDAMIITHVIGKPDFAAVTIAEYETLFGAGKRELCRLLSIPEDSPNLRDNLNSYALLALMTAELSAADLMQQVGRLLTSNEQVMIARDACEDVRPTFERVAAKAGQTLTAKRLTDGK